MRVSGGRRAGRSHRQQDVPCQDAFALLTGAGNGRVAAAVADGLGSRAQSHRGSEVACRAALARLETEPAWDEKALRGSFAAAHEAVRASANDEGGSADDWACTLQVAGLVDGKAVAGMVGDGAVVVGAEGVTILLAPAASEYANEVAPVTHPAWRDHFRYAEHDVAQSLLVFTDGLTRLLLARSKGAWQPFQPFFDAFLPQLRGPAFDEELVPRFLDADYVDQSWDDDKCLVVMGRDDASP